MCASTQLLGYGDNAACVTDEMHWYAIRTRSRHEKVAVAQLQHRNIETYLPLVPVVHRWSDRHKLIHVPLFPGYAFVRFVLSAYSMIPVLSADGVVGFVGARAQATPIPEEEIGNIRTILAHEIPYAYHPFLKTGQRIRVRGGPLHGVEGTLVGRKGERSLIISIDLLQRSLAVRIEGYDVEVV